MEQFIKPVEGQNVVKKPRRHSVACQFRVGL